MTEQQINAMRQALDALDCIDSPLYMREIEKVGSAMSALRVAIEQAEKAQGQGPVASVSSQHTISHK